jgi:Pectate lyase superfamily protein
MAVFLSPFGGVGAQFFDNNGNILAGGQIYTYAAGTNTATAVYTSSSGNIAHSNPIILDASGRVPGGEIWMTDGIAYKFVLNSANGSLIATYDNIVGINSNFVNFTNQQEIQTATAGQTVFTLTTMQYQPSTGSLSVFVDGVNQYGPGAQYAFTETSSTVVTFVNGLHVGASVKFTTSAINASSYGTAFDISYTPPFTSSVATNVGEKLAQTISVMDFGAVGDGVADDTAAIQAAINEAITRQSTLVFPGGYYRISSSLNVTQPINIEGNRAQIYQETADVSVFYFNGGGTTAGFIRNTCVVKDLILGCAAGLGRVINIYQFMNCTFQDITIPYSYKGVQCVGGILNVFNNVRVSGTMPTSPGFFVSTGVQTTNHIGFHFYSGDVSDSNANTLIQCYAQNSERSSYEFAGGNNNVLINCDSEFAPSPTGYHIYADSALNLQVISGDWEGVTALHFWCICKQSSHDHRNHKRRCSQGRYLQNHYN